MGRALEDKEALDAGATTSRRPLVAHLQGGPFHGHEYVLYRGRKWCSLRMHRGIVRRSLGMSKRYAWYELERTWEEDEVPHGDYVFRKVRSKPVGPNGDG
jgi:hypothetical protein